MPSAKTAKRILLIEDDEFDQVLISRTISRGDALGWELVTAGSLAEGHELIDENESGHFSCVLLDLNLPDGVGLDFLRERAAHLPIVVLTGADETVKECLASGAQDYLVKGNFDRDALVRAVDYSVERFRLHRTLVEQSEHLRASNADLEQFASLASHDLREPLRTISAFTHLVLEREGDTLSDRSRSDLDRITQAAERMNSLIHALLDLSSISRVSRPFSLVKIKENLQLVIDDLEASIAESGIDMRLDLPEGELAVWGDSIQLRQLFQNLVSNAIRYRKRDEDAESWVEVAVQAEDDNALLVVKDNGVGFAPEQRERIFLPFRRLHSRSSAYGKGTGIGLAMATKIVNRHGGELWAESEPGEGSTFFARLPLPSAKGQSPPPLERSTPGRKKKASDSDLPLDGEQRRQVARDIIAADKAIERARTESDDAQAPARQSSDDGQAPARQS